MILPLDRRRMRARNRLDEEEELDAMERLAPDARLAQALELSTLVRALALGLGNRDLVEDADDLEEKSRLYARPLRLLAGR
jgi:hypothetical protein